MILGDIYRQDVADSMAEVFRQTIAIGLIGGGAAIYNSALMKERLTSPLHKETRALGQSRVRKEHRDAERGDEGGKKRRGAWLPQEWQQFPLAASGDRPPL